MSGLLIPERTDPDRRDRGHAAPKAYSGMAMMNMRLVEATAPRAITRLVSAMEYGTGRPRSGILRSRLADGGAVPAGDLALAGERTRLTEDHEHDVGRVVGETAHVAGHRAEDAVLGI